MKIYPLGIAIVVSMSVAACSGNHSFYVINDQPFERLDEIVELDASVADSLSNGKVFKIVDKDGKEVPYQRTFDGLIIFPATVDANSRTEYSIIEGSPASVDTVACGAFYQWRKDDLAWENDRCAYRAYGPALQASGEKAYGYDVWTKSVGHPVVAQRYADTFAGIRNFHNDYGDGMDVYTVGPTLGAGTAALIDDEGQIIYPASFKSFEVLDNGPLRFSVRFKYDSAADSSIVETRTISLDKGSFLNRTTVSFDALPAPMTFAPGIVVHRQNPDGFSLDQNEKVMAYADLTDNENAGNGIIFIGVVAPQADLLSIEKLEQAPADAAGHLLAKGKIHPDSTYTYYWGAGWSKGYMPDWQSWKEYLSEYKTKIDNPLKIEL